MTHEDRGHYAKKHAADRKANPEISEAVRQRGLDGKISCAVAHKIANDLKVSPAKVGFATDLLEIRMVKCQLGLYGYGPKKSIVKPAVTVSQELEKAVKESLVDGRLPCKGVWGIAEKLNIGKMEVSSACEALEIKICSCQLGAF